MNIDEIIYTEIKDECEHLNIKHSKHIKELSGPIYDKLNNKVKTGTDKFKIISALDHSIESSLGHMFERIANKIAKFNYEVFTYVVNQKIDKNDESINCDCLIKDNDKYYLIEVKKEGNLDTTKNTGECKILMEKKNKICQKLCIDESDIELVFGTMLPMNKSNKKSNNKKSKKRLVDVKVLHDKDFIKFLTKSQNNNIWDEYLKSYIKHKEELIDKTITNIAQRYYHATNCGDIENCLW